MSAVATVHEPFASKHEGGVGDGRPGGDGEAEGDCDASDEDGPGRAGSLGDASIAPHATTRTVPAHTHAAWAQRMSVDVVRLAGQLFGFMVLSRRHDAEVRRLGPGMLSDNRHDPYIAMQQARTMVLLAWVTWTGSPGCRRPRRGSGFRSPMPQS